MQAEFRTETENILSNLGKIPELTFQEVALSIFRLQYKHCNIYKRFCEALKVTSTAVQELKDIPYLPVDFFKTHKVTTGDWDAKLTFKSSGTTGQDSSHHHIKDLKLYEESFSEHFNLSFGTAEDLCILGLLPSYLEKGDSSLVYMVDALIKKSKYTNSGFFLDDHNALATVLKYNEENKIPTILFGVTYALLDFVDFFPMKLHYTTIVETGGMKGRKKEMTKAEVHLQLQKAFSLPYIASEYGMTELLSQAYAIKDQKYHTSNAMRVLLRNEDDPLTVLDSQDCKQNAQTGIVNIIDLYNIYSCAFVATDDVGKLYSDGTFEILGRRDNSDIRGCSLLTV